MVWLRIKKLMDGPGPGEALVTFSTMSGKAEQVVIDQSAIENNMILVGYPLREKEEQSLIELPRETMSGRWRVWVPNTGTVIVTP